MPERFPIQRNAFESLPEEIFVIIVHKVLGIDSVAEFPVRRPYEIQRLRDVNRRWNAIIESTPTVWTLLDCSDPPSWIIKALARAAKSKFLDIRYDGVTRGHPWRMDIEEFLAVVVPAITRWRSLFIVLGERLEIPKAILKPAATNLKHLIIYRKDYVQRPPKLDDLFGGNTPCLLSMRIHLQPIRWGSSIFTSVHLQRLEIRRPFDNEITLFAMLNTLSCLTQLRYLTVCAIYFKRDDDQATRIQDNSVVLNDLARIEWSADSDHIKDILRALQYPSSCDVAICCHFNFPPHPETPYLIYSNLSPQVNRLRAVGEEITLIVDAKDGIVITTRSRSLFFQCTGAELDPFVSFLQDHSKVFATIPTALIYYFADTENRIQDIDMLTGLAIVLPNVSTLVVTNGHKCHDAEVLKVLKAICGSTKESPALRKAFQSIRLIETPARDDEDFYNDLIAHLDEFEETEPSFVPPILRFPTKAGIEYPNKVAEFVTRHPWAELREGPSATEEHFGDLMPRFVNGELHTAPHPRT